MNVSPRSVAHAKTVQEHCSPELQKAVDAGEISPSRAACEITETQKRIADPNVTKSGKLKTSDERRAEELEAKSETVSDLDSAVISRILAAIRATELRRIDRDESPPLVMAPEEEAAWDAFYDIEDFFVRINDLDPKAVASNLNEDDEDEPSARERALSCAESCIRWFTDFAEALRGLSPAPAPAPAEKKPSQAERITNGEITIKEAERELGS